MNPFRTKKFKELQAQWYEKLKKEGFEEIEDTNSSKEFLKVWHSSYFKIRHTPDSFEATKMYYDLAESFLENKFSNEQLDLFEKHIDGMIWEMHSKGLSIRDISKKVNATNFYVNKVITDLKKKMLKRK